MNQNPIIKALQEELSKERDELADAYASHLWGEHSMYYLDCNSDYKSGHEAASTRLLSIVEKHFEALERAEKMLAEVDNYLNWRTDALCGDDLIGDGRLTIRFKGMLSKIENTREHLIRISADETTLADASGEINKDGK